MIPPDVASRLQANADTALRPVAPTQEITDKLSGLVSGQRVMAEIQALLPNGTYRALINQRNITLALPFAAKSGDSLELQVTESDGKQTLAVVSHQRGEPQSPREAVSATLSRTGQLISNLFSGANEAKSDSKALPLNGNAPIAPSPPASAQDILPLLKDAITKSGMFYESHQAEWVEGRFAKSALLQEPQGKLSAAVISQTDGKQSHQAEWVEGRFAKSALLQEPQGKLSAAVISQTDGKQPPSPPSTTPVATDQALRAKSASDAPPVQSSTQIMAPQTQPIVQQQLEALANQTFVWQGQIWPGQQMRWEIEEDRRREQDGETSAVETWHTNLDLKFPVLGGISAKLHLVNNQVALSIVLDDEHALPSLQAGAEAFRQQLTDAGLVLASMGITTHAPNEPT